MRINVRDAYADYIAQGAEVTLTNSAGNGGKPVLVLVSPFFDPTRPATVHTHYHGWAATIADRMGDGGQAQARMREVQARDPQVVFVLPECNNPVYGKGPQSPFYKADWSNVRSQAQTTDDALAAAGITRVRQRVVSAHSAGGFALERAMQRDLAGGRGVEADRLELLDCFYGPEHTIAAWAKTDAGAATRSVSYVRGTNDHSAKPVERAFADRYERIDVRGTKTMNPHTRANADFMHLQPPAIVPPMRQLVQKA